MVAPYVGGQRIEWADIEKLWLTSPAEAGQIEFRNEVGEVLGLVVTKIKTFDDDPDWVKAITPEEIKRRMAEPSYTFEELKKRLSWE